MTELTMTNPGREETERLTDRVWLLALGTYHRKVCVGLDLGGELEILGEELARMRAAGEPIEEVHAFLAKHGIHVSELVKQPQVDRVGKQILDYLAESNESRTRVEIEDHVEGRTGQKRTVLKNLCITGKVAKVGTVWLLKVVRALKADPEEVRRLQAYGDPTLAQLSYARECTREMEGRGELRPCGNRDRRG
jgi:hypothetical protein